MATTTKPKTNVEAMLYTGRTKTTFKTKDETEIQDPADRHAEGYSGDVPDSRRSGDQHGLNPCFDKSPARGKEKK
jgi:hypothetical protein